MAIATRTPEQFIRRLKALTAAPIRRRLVSRLSIRIFTVNVMALIVLAGGLLYLSRYQQELISGELQGLERQAQIYAGAIAEAARYSSTITAQDPGVGIMMRDSLSRERTRNMVRRLGETTVNRIRVYDDQAHLLGDSDVLGGAGGIIREVPLPPMTIRQSWSLSAQNGFIALADALPSGLPLKDYPEQSRAVRVFKPGELNLFPDVREAMEGRTSSNAWRSGISAGDILLSAAAPVQHLKQVLGVVYVTRDGGAIAESIRQMKLDILKLFFIALALTFVLSLYLAASIAKPLRRLSRAAEQVRRGMGRQAEIPDLTRRRDEIGDLSEALRSMTSALAARLDSIERFAADVSHELKNPLTSLRSAVETAGLVKDPQDRERLMDIIIHDVQRLDRLITDISAASRLDAELSREDLGLVDLRILLSNMVSSYLPVMARMRDEFGAKAEKLPVVLMLPPEDEIMIVPGLEGRLAQVFRNLIDNALSFSPKGIPVRIRAEKEARVWKIMVEDSGPGIPDAKVEAIFERFYSERPEGEDFGKHSGLGLSISKQIVDAHHGKIFAENMIDDNGQKKGARFTVMLNALG